MKYLTLIIVLFALNVNAQSLSEVTGENKSLYNAICIYNDIAPGSITMTEFRVLAVSYAEEVGCTDYDLYLYNGGNNLYILNYKVATVVTKLDTVVNTVVEVITDTLVTVVFDTVVLVKTDTITVEKTVVKTQVKEYCDCNNLDINQAWSKYELLQTEYKADVSNHNGGINSMCQVKVKKYIHQLQRQIYLDKINERLEDKFDTQDLASSKIISNITPKRVKKSKKRKYRRLGKGHSRTANNSFIQKIFPFINC